MFYWVLPSFPWYYLVLSSLARFLPSFTEFFLVLPSFVESYSVFTEFYLVFLILMGFTEFFLVVLGFVELYWAFTEFYRVFRYRLDRTVIDIPGAKMYFKIYCRPFRWGRRRKWFRFEAAGGGGGGGRFDRFAFMQMNANGGARPPPANQRRPNRSTAGPRNEGKDIASKCIQFFSSSLF